MPDYTFQVDMEDDEGDWFLGEPARITDDRAPSALADWLADRHAVKDGADWRIRVWHGHDADTDAPPACSLVVNEYEP